MKPLLSSLVSFVKSFHPTSRQKGSHAGERRIPIRLILLCLLLLAGLLVGLKWSYDQFRKFQSSRLDAVALSYIKINKISEAKMTLETALRLNPKDPTALRLQLNLQKMDGKADASLSSYQQLARSGRMSLTDLRPYANLASNQGDMKLARRIAESAAKSDPMLGHLINSDLSMKEHHATEAALELRKAVEVGGTLPPGAKIKDDGTPEAKERLSAALQARGDLPRMELVRFLIAHGPQPLNLPQMVEKSINTSPLLSLTNDLSKESDGKKVNMAPLLSLKNDPSKESGDDVRLNMAPMISGSLEGVDKSNEKISKKGRAQPTPSASPFVTPRPTPAPTAISTPFPSPSFSPRVEASRAVSTPAPIPVATPVPYVPVYDTNELSTLITGLSTRTNSVGSQALALGLEIGIVPPAEQADWILRLRKHPKVTPQMLLLADAATIQGNPAEKPRVVEGVVARLKEAPLDQRFSGAAWLLRMREPQQAELLVTRDESMKSPEAFMIWMTPRQIDGHWDQIFEALKLPNNPLPPYQRDLFAAEALTKETKENQKAEGEKAFAKVLSDYGKKSPECYKVLLFLNVAGEQALYEKGVQNLFADPTLAQNALPQVLDVMRHRSDATKLLGVAEQALASPQLSGNVTAQNEQAYQKLVLNEPVNLVELSNRTEANPNEFSYRVTEALSLLKSGDKVKAREVLESIEATVDSTKIPSYQKGVLAMVLEANGDHRNALGLISQIKPSEMTLQELSIIRAAFPQQTRASEMGMASPPSGPTSSNSTSNSISSNPAPASLATPSSLPKAGVLMKKPAEASRN